MCGRYSFSKPNDIIECSGRKMPPKINFGGLPFPPRGLVLPAICRITRICSEVQKVAIIDKHKFASPLFKCDQV